MSKLTNLFVVMIFLLGTFPFVAHAQKDLLHYGQPPPGSIEILPDQNHNSLEILIEKIVDLDKDEEELENLIRRLSENDLPLFNRKEIYCMARNLFHEAANEPEEGIVAVGVVTLNRLAHPDYPKTICDVVYQRGVTDYLSNGRHRSFIVCQFSWTCERIRVPRDDDPHWIKCQQIAAHLLDGGYPQWRKKYQESLHYHAFYVNPRWPLKRLFRTGAHIFYN